MLQFSCPHCQHTITAKEELSGKAGRCPKCRGTVTIPAAERPPLPDTVKMTDEQRRALEQRIKGKKSKK